MVALGRHTGMILLTAICSEVGVKKKVFRP